MQDNALNSIAETNWNKYLCRFADICPNDSKYLNKCYISWIQRISLPVSFVRTEKGQIEIHQHKSPQINSHTHEQRQTHMQLNTVLHTRRIQKRRCNILIFILVNVNMHFNYTCGCLVRFIPVLYPRLKLRSDVRVWYFQLYNCKQIHECQHTYIVYVNKSVTNTLHTNRKVYINT